MTGGRSAMALQIDEDRQQGIYPEVEAGMSLSQGGLDRFGRLASREDKAQIAVPLRQRHERVVQAGGDLDTLDERHGSSVLPT